MFNLTYDPMPGEQRPETVLMMLPGVGMHAGDYQSHGFIEAMRDRGLAVDVVMADIGAEKYMSEEFGRCMGEAIVSPLLAERYRYVWLAGISLGAYGAMRLLQDCPGRISGALLLAPFLSTRGTVAGILQSGGLDQWSPGATACHNTDEALLGWLKENLVAGNFPVEIYLGWGEEDRYADGGKLLAERLPRDRVFRTRGDHDWATWKSLWLDMLDAAPFAARGKVQ